MSQSILLKKQFRRLSILSLGVFLVTSCKNRHKPSQKSKLSYELKADSVQDVNNLVEEDGGKLFNSPMRNWLSKNLPSSIINWSNFKFIDNSPLNIEDSSSYVVDNQFFKDYQSVLRWSADSSLLVDFGSYGSTPVKDKNGKTYLEGTDPESYVYIIDLKHLIKKQILHTGPSLQIRDVKWMDSAEFVMILVDNSSATTKEKYQIWLVDCRSNSFRSYLFSPTPE